MENCFFLTYFLIGDPFRSHQIKRSAAIMKQIEEKFKHNLWKSISRYVILSSNPYEQIEMKRMILLWS